MKVNKNVNLCLYFSNNVFYALKAFPTREQYEFKITKYFIYVNVHNNVLSVAGQPYKYFLTFIVITNILYTLCIRLS